MLVYGKENEIIIAYCTFVCLDDRERYYTILLYVCISYHGACNAVTRLLYVVKHVIYESTLLLEVCFVCRNGENNV